MDQRNLKKARKDAETSEPSSKINPSEALEPEKKKAKIVKGQKSTKPVKATGTPKSQLQNAALKEAKDTPKSDNDLSSKTKEASGSGTLLDLGKTEDEVVNVHDSEKSTNSQIISKEKSQIDEKHQEKLGEALEPEKKTVKILKRKNIPKTVKATATPKSKLQNAAIIEAKGTPKSDNDMSSQTNEASGTLPDLEKTEDEVVNAHDAEKNTNSPIPNKEESQIDEKHRDKLGEVLESGKKKVKIVKVKKSIKTVNATGTPKSQLQNAVMREAKGTTKSDNDMSSNSKEATGNLLNLGKTEDEVVNAHDNDSQITNTEKSQNEEKHREQLGEALEPNKKKVKKVKGQKSAKTVKATSTPKSKLQNAAISEGKGTPKSENNMSSKTKEARSALQDQEKIKNEVLNARDKGKSTNSKVIKKEKSQIDDKHQEKLGGLIFMCNSKTKSDCFKYKVMGLPAGHQELVRSIKPGRKLFLYDVGQKLLYGIYSASAAGGMKLEPNAFDGSYPAQVRFKVHKECLPLPESVFKKAIEENYIEKKRWFKTELTVQQVQKLTKLFLASKTNIPTQNTPPQKPLGESAIKSQSEKVHKDLPPKDWKSVDESRRYYGMPPIYQRGQVFSGHQETVPSLKLPRDPLFLSEKEYRAFGLVREPIQTPEAPAPPQVYSAGFSVDPNLTGRDHPHQNQYDPTSSNLYPVPPMRATAATSTYPYEVSMFPDQMDYHERGSERRLLASQAPRQATSAAATLSYGYPGRAEIEYSRQLDGEIPSSRYARSELSGYEGGRTRTGETERLNPTYAFGAATDYERRQPQLVSRPQLEALPVSSRYSFAGPSLYYS